MSAVAPRGTAPASVGQPAVGIYLDAADGAIDEGAERLAGLGLVEAQHAGAAVLQMQGIVDLGLEEGRAGRQRGHFGHLQALQLEGAGGAAAVLALVGAQHAVEAGIVVAEVAQQVHHGRALLVAQVLVEDAAHAGGVGHPHGAAAVAVVALGPALGLVHPGAGIGRGGKGLQR
uniref:Uncharacterized protein n=1 Tax=Tanacetum cinerariifolium TaxID=118510 RepID=A0A699Q7C5_TANCI|nr:hypothetical protein [Tanacetum cinerariifolium]